MTVQDVKTHLYIHFIFNLHDETCVKTNIMNIISVLSHYPVVVQWKQISKTSTFHELMRTFSAFVTFQVNHFKTDWIIDLEGTLWSFWPLAALWSRCFLRVFFLSWTCTCTLVTQYTVPPMVSHYSNYIQVDVTCGELQQCTRKGREEEDCK